MVQENLKIA
jgi:hypothetical protein